MCVVESNDSLQSCNRYVHGTSRKQQLKVLSKFIIRHGYVLRSYNSVVLTSAVREESSSGGTTLLSPSFMASNSAFTQPTIVNMAYSLQKTMKEN